MLDLFALKAHGNNERLDPVSTRKDKPLEDSGEKEVEEEVEERNDEEKSFTRKVEELAPSASAARRDGEISFLNLEPPVMQILRRICIQICIYVHSLEINHGKCKCLFLDSHLFCLSNYTPKRSFGLGF